MKTFRLSGAVCVAGLLMATLAGWNAFAQSNPRQRSEDRAARNERQYGFRGVITGRVTFPNGAPAAGFRVRARFVRHQTGALGEGDALTGPDGRYAIRGLNPQGFRVFVDNEGKPYVTPPPRRVDLQERAENVDFVVRLGPEITIRIRDAETGQPVPGITVEANRSVYSSPQPVGVTDARGEFRFRAGQLETELRLEFSRNGESPIDVAPGYSRYHRVRLTEVQPVTWEVRTYRNAHQSAPAIFRGVVIGPDGKPAPGAEVRMIRNSRQERTTADRAGRFAFQTVRMTDYEQANRGIILRADKGPLSATTFPKAADTWETIVVRLEARPRPSLAGVVVDPRGKPLAGVPVVYYELFPGSSAQFTLYPSNGGVTDTRGRFHIPDLSTEAAYHLHFGNVTRFPGMENLAFGTVEFPVAKTTGDYLRLRAGERRDIGRIVVPVADAVVAGRVVDAKGRPVSTNVMLVLQGRTTKVSATPDAQGRFRLEPVVREPLTLHVFRGDGHFFRTAPDSPDLLLRMPVRAGNTRLQVVLPKLP